MGKTKFDFTKEFEVISFDGMHTCRNRVMCDYLAKITINQNGTYYFGEVGYVGRELMSTQPKYLFIENKVFDLEGTPLFDLSDNDNEFTKWLMY